MGVSALKVPRRANLSLSTVCSFSVSLSASCCKRAFSSCIAADSCSRCSFCLHAPPQLLPCHWTHTAHHCLQAASCCIQAAQHHTQLRMQAATHRIQHQRCIEAILSHWDIIRGFNAGGLLHIISVSQCSTSEGHLAVWPAASPAPYAESRCTA